MMVHAKAARIGIPASSAARFLQNVAGVQRCALLVLSTYLPGYGSVW